MAKQVSLPPYTFGVELECFGVPATVVAWTLVQAGIPAVDAVHGIVGERHDREAAASARYDSTTWVVGSDGSVNGPHPLEIKSPVLKGPEGIATLRKALRTLTSLGLKTDHSTGLHVHVGVKNAPSDYAYTPKTSVELLKLWAKNEKEIEALVRKSRRAGQNGYCRPASERLKDLETRVTETPVYTCEAPPPNWRQYRDVDWETYRLYGYGEHRWASDGRKHMLPEPKALSTMTLDALGLMSNHYDAVSLASLRKYGTIEIRLHHGSLDDCEVTNWVLFVLGQVDMARKIDRGQVNKGRGRKPGLFANLPLGLRSHFKKQAAKFEAEEYDGRRR